MHKSYSSWSEISESILVQNFPLHRACRDGDTNVLSNLLEKDSTTVNIIRMEDTYYGWTPFHWASYFGKLECLRMLVNRADIIGINLKTSRFHQTPAHIAAFAGHPHCLQWLIHHGAEIDAQDYLGESPLHKSARSGSLQCCLILTTNGANIRLQNLSGKSSVELAESCRHDEIAKTLKHQESNGVSPLSKYVSSNSYHGHHINVSPTQKAEENDVDMEVENSPVHTTQDDVNMTDKQHGSCTHNPLPPVKHVSLNGYTDSCFHSPSNGIINLHKNGYSNGFHNNGFKDLTLCPDVSLNMTPVAGRKRSREEIFSEPQMKRKRTEGDNIFINNNKLFEQNTLCSVGGSSMTDHVEAMIAECGYDAVKLQELMADAHGC